MPTVGELKERIASFNDLYDQARAIEAQEQQIQEEMEQVAEKKRQLEVSILKVSLKYGLDLEDVKRDVEQELDDDELERTLLGLGKRR